MPCVRDVLAEKAALNRDAVHTISANTSVLDAVRRMNQHRVGAMVVVDDAHQVVGMFTERDVLRLVAALQDICQIIVRDVMSHTVHSANLSTDLEDVQELMRHRRVRHVPILDDHDHLVGIISIGDLNAWALSHQARQLEGLSEYIFGRA